MNKPLILRPTEVGRLLGIKRSRVYELLKRGILPSVRIAGAIWIPRPALEEWLNSQSELALAVTRGKKAKVKQLQENSDPEPD